MRIVCIGGGPAGLYFALLMKKLHPEHRVTVVERNRPYDTFGWGVVFSDATMDSRCGRGTRETADDDRGSPSITGTTSRCCSRAARMRTTGHGFVGIGRKKLLNILQARCEELGVELVFEREVDVRSRVPRRRPDHRLRRRQFEAPQPLCGGVPARHGHAAQPLHLARHRQALRRLHLRLPQDRARLVPGAHLQVRRRHLDLHRRDHRRDVSRRTASTRSTRTARSPSARTCSPKCWTAHKLMTNARHLRGSAWLNFQSPDLRQVEPFQRQQPCRADGRRRPYRAFRHRLGHQARASTTRSS